MNTIFVDSRKFAVSHRSKGFTLIEVLVVIAVTALISSYVIIYSKVSQNQIALQIETQKIANLILAAKFAAVATLDTPERQMARALDPSGPRILCGYGFEITYSDPASYRIFSYEPQAVNCAGIDFIREEDRFFVPTTLFPTSSSIVPAGLKLRAAPGSCSSPPCNVLRVVLFVPPEPRTLLSDTANGAITPGGGNSHWIYLTTADDSFEKTIEVSPAGQVDF